MSAPVTERTRTQAVGVGRTRFATIPAQRGSTVVAPKPDAARRAYAKRDERVRRLVGPPPVRGGTATGRAQFVLLVMGLLGAGLVATLWLSTAAAADSYRLQDARSAARTLSEQSERLHREVASMASPPALAKRATGLGMVPVQDPARLVVSPNGAVQVVGKPRAAVAPAPPVAPVAPVAPGAPGPGVDPGPGGAPAGPVDPAAGVDPAAVGDPVGTDPAGTDPDARPDPTAAAAAAPESSDADDPAPAEPAAAPASQAGAAAVGTA